MLAFYVVGGRARRASRPSALAGTIQADILKEYIAQKEWCFPIDPAMRLLGDMVEWCSQQMPRWHPVSISGYHIREAGSTAAQELAFTLKDGLTYVEQAVDARPRRRRLRAAAVASSSTRRSTSSRRSPSTARRGGSGRASCATRSARKRPAVVADALPHADRRRVADRAAAAEQHRAHRDRGARRRARRHAVAAHQLLRRGARAADRGRGADRAAHAADHRPRDRRGEHDRPARRQLLRRGAHRRARAPGPTPTSPASTSSAAWSQAVKRQLPAARDRRRLLRAPAARSTPGRRIVVGVNRYRVEDETPLPILRIDPALERKQVGRVCRRSARARDAGEGGARPGRPAAKVPRPTSTSCRPCSMPPASTRPRARSCRRSRTSGATTPRPRSSRRTTKPT